MSEKGISRVRSSRCGATICLFAQDCGKALILEHNGDVYSCDHFMYPDYRLGNIGETGLSQLANSPEQQAFGKAKSADRSRKTTGP